MHKNNIMEESSEIHLPQEESKKLSLFKNSLIHGCILGGIIAFITFVLNLMGASDTLLTVFQFSFIALIMASMFLGTKSYRENHLNGYISYGKAFWSTFLIGAISSIVVAAYMFVFYQIYPEEIIKILEKVEEKFMENPDLKQEQLDMMMVYTKKFTTPFWIFLWSALGNIFYSAIFGLIISIFVKKKDNSFESNFQ